MEEQICKSGHIPDVVRLIDQGADKNRICKWVCKFGHL